MGRKCQKRYSYSFASFSTKCYVHAACDSPHKSHLRNGAPFVTRGRGDLFNLNVVPLTYWPLMLFWGHLGHLSHQLACNSKTAGC